MQEEQVDQQPETRKLARTFGRLKRKLMARHLYAVRFAALLVFVICFLGAFLLVRQAIRGSSVERYLQMANSFLFIPENSVEEAGGRTNILLLGKAGDGVKNPTLTDTMIVMSINRQERKIVLISVPRDIWVPDLTDKINSAYYWGNERAEGGGLKLAKSAIEEVVGVPIHYAAAIDFDGFLKVIDILGGVTVDVEREFTDNKFPIPGREDDTCGIENPRDGEEYACRYETVHFEAGEQTMNGETALKYARSRHSTDPTEGTDLARAARQQKVMLAIKNKAFAKETLLSPRKLLVLWSTFWEITETDLSHQELACVGRLLLDNKENLATHTIPEDLLVSPPYSDEYRNLYVFLPKAQDWSEFHDWVAGVLGSS